MAAGAKGIDVILKEEWCGKPVCIRIQRSGETVDGAANALRRAATGKGGAKLILVVTDDQWGLLGKDGLPSDVTLVDSAAASIRGVLGVRTPSLGCLAS